MSTTRSFLNKNGLLNKHELEGVMSFFLTPRFNRIDGGGGGGAGRIRINCNRECKDAHRQAILLQRQ